jgi:DNA-binding transcriptional ArsR family regulator
MDARHERFVEGMGQWMESHGLPRMAGRMYAWLLICEPPEQTAAELAEALQASRGAISGSARMLTGMGLVRRATRRGDRREYFSVPPGSITRLVESGSSAYQALVDLADEGLVLLRKRPAGERARLEEVRDVYAFFVREFPRMLTRLRKEQRTRERKA